MKKKEFKLVFDNGGGVIFQSRSFCHFYSDGADLAKEVHEFFKNGGDTKGWDGDEHEFRNASEDWCQVYDEQDVAAMLNTLNKDIISKVLNLGDDSIDKFEIDEIFHKHLSGRCEIDFFKALLEM